MKLFGFERVLQAYGLAGDGVLETAIASKLGSYKKAGAKASQLSERSLIFFNLPDHTL
jgi:hypothetical protein